MVKKICCRQCKRATRLGIKFSLPPSRVCLCVCVCVCERDQKSAAEPPAFCVSRAEVCAFFSPPHTHTFILALSSCCLVVCFCLCLGVVDAALLTFLMPSLHSFDSGYRATIHQCHPPSPVHHLVPSPLIVLCPPSNSFYACVAVKLHVAGFGIFLLCVWFLLLRLSH
jgi:hypothetical protein